MRVEYVLVVATALLLAGCPGHLDTKLFNDSGITTSDASPDANIDAGSTEPNDGGSSGD